MAKEDWRLCADWLVRCKILAGDHKVTWPQAEVFDLAQTLRDGVLICHLLNALKPGSVDMKEFSQRPQMSQFLCLKNTRVFLQTCRLKFNMADRDLFDPADLFDMKDFGKVINTLSKLSKCQLAQRSGIPGFPPDRDIRRDSDYYNSLEEMANDIEDEPLYDLNVNKEQDDAEDIYGELMNVRRRHIPKPPSSQHLTQRDHCVKELVETEKNYVEALTMLVTHFIHPLKNVLGQKDRDIIFLGIEELSEIHKGFHVELERATRSGGSGVGPCFTTWKKKFLLYGDFCSNLPKAQELIDELCRRSPIISQKIMECQMSANQGKFRLRDLLSVPMQRVLKYHLLLQQLKKQTDEKHPERRALEKALEAMQDLSWYVNEVKRDNETLQLILEIQNSIVDLQMPDNTEMKDYGKLLKDGEIRVKTHGDNKTRGRYVFLFDKVLLMCKSRGIKAATVSTVPRYKNINNFAKKFHFASFKDSPVGETYGFKVALNLSFYRVEEPPTSTPKPKAQPWTYNFLLVEKSDQIAFTFYTKTEDMKRKWMDAIAMALDNMRPAGACDNGHEFVMHSFKEPTECDACGKLLRGVYYQGYMCHGCSRAAHKECIRKTRGCIGVPELPPRPTVTPVVRPNRTSKGKCKATYAYKGMPEPGDGRRTISFEIGDVIEILNDDDPNWWEGRIRDTEGFFPQRYVERIKRPIRIESMSEKSRDGLNHRPCLVHRPSLESQVTGHMSPRSQSPAAIVRSSSQNAASPMRRRVPATNNDITNYNWYVGEMSREQAMNRLEHHMNGTYLIRACINPTRLGEYALSIKYGSSVKHIKVQKTPDRMFFLADCKVFKSIPDLVEYYQQNSLHTSFPELNTTLVLAYKDAVQIIRAPGNPPPIIGYCRAQFDYAANQPNQLSLKRDDRIAIISKAGDDRGWWKGILRERTGYFPRAYVQEEGEDELS